jgi:tetratricopeptide (TPR) repeat protein
LSRETGSRCHGQGGRKMKWVYMKGISIEAQYLYRKARELSQQERYETALRYFTQAVVIAPRYSKAFYEMANCQANLGKYDDAIRLYNRAIDIDPACEEALIQRDRVIGTRERNMSPQQFMGTSWLMIQ